MNTAVMAFGSNVADKVGILQAAVASIECAVVEKSDIYTDDNGYANIVAAVSTDLDYNSLRQYTKNLELRFGRKPSSKAPEDVALDIDIVVFNGEIIRPVDFVQPYFCRGYCRLSKFKV